MKSQRGKNFCILPWVHLQMSPNGKVHSCCQTTFRKSLGDANQQTLDEIWNGSEYTQLRQKMLLDEPIAECKGCHMREALGHQSLRTISNKEYADVEIDEIHNPIYLDLRFDNKCNFKCRTCTPIYSTSWKSDFVLLIPEAATQLHDYEISEQTYEQIKSWLRGIQTIYFAGGEPLLSKYHARILMDLIAIDNQDVKLLYNTNLSVVSQDVIDLWAEFPSLAISASVDGTRDIGEFIRKGFRWENFVKNRMKIREYCPHAHFKIDWTLSIYNVFHFPQAIQDLLNAKVIDSVNQIYINYLHDPAYLSPKILVESEKQKLQEHYDRKLVELKSGLVADDIWTVVGLFSKILKFVREPVDPSLRIDFKIFNGKLDRIRQESSHRLFPDLENLL